MKEKPAITSTMFGSLRDRALWSYKDLNKYLAYTTVDDVFDIWAMFDYEDKHRRRKTIMIRLLERARTLDTWRWVAEIKRQVKPKNPMGPWRNGLKRMKGNACTRHGTDRNSRKILLTEKKVDYLS